VAIAIDQLQDLMMGPSPEASMDVVIQRGFSDHELPASEVIRLHNCRIQRHGRRHHLRSV